VKRRNRSLQIFTLSALDVLAMAAGVFVLIATILMPYYRKNFDAFAEIEGLRVQTSELQAEAERTRRGAEELGAEAEAVRQEMEELGAKSAALRAAAFSKKKEAQQADKQAAAAQRKLQEFDDAVDAKLVKQLDLVFVVDSTGSMADVLNDLGFSIAGIVRVLERLVPSPRIGVVAYRDKDITYPAGSRDAWVTNILRLTHTRGDGLRRITQFARSLQIPKGRGKTWTEDMYRGLVEAEALEWRENAKQILIVIGDAAAHVNERERTMNLIRKFNARSNLSTVSTLWVPTQAFTFYGKGDDAFFSAMARAGGGNASAYEGELIEAVILSVLE